MVEFKRVKEKKRSVIKEIKKKLTRNWSLLQRKEENLAV